MHRSDFRPLALRLAAMVIATAIALAGAFAARAASLPLPLMLGSLVALGGVSILRLSVFGITPRLPEGLRTVFIPVIGVAIGAGFSPALLAEAGRWLTSLAAVALFVPLAHALGYQVYRRMGGLAPSTAFFSAMPGGLFEALEMGEAAGADRQMLVVLQFLRLILCILLVPIGFTLLTGQVVGSAAGVRLQGASLPYTPADVLLLVAAGVGGVLVGRLVRLPGGLITGPLFASAAIHLAGFTATVPPPFLIGVTQLVMGATLGLRFWGMPGRTFGLALRLAGVNVAAMLGLAMVFAAVLHAILGERLSTVLLAFAPGGVAEMSLVALSLRASVAFVSAHHILRIVIAVAMAQAGHRLVLGRRREEGR
ncbi:MAG: AbrB family transcriptional regulator [Rhodobacteraceae bacterium]|nr:AbrB family transcriptional regulator [Paracoccaceae bacterium]